MDEAKPLCTTSGIEQVVVYFHGADLEAEKQALRTLPGLKSHEQLQNCQRLVLYTCDSSVTFLTSLKGFGDLSLVSAALSSISHAALIAVEGMTCNSCVKLIESTVSQRDGVAAVRVSLNHKEAFVQFDPGLESANDLVTAIYDMGFDAELKMELSSPDPTETGGEEEIVIGVEGMVCHSCVQNIEMNIGKMRGVREVKVSLEGKNARVNYDPSLVTTRELSDAIEDLGFEPKLPERRKELEVTSNEQTLQSSVNQSPEPMLSSGTRNEGDTLVMGSKKVCCIGIQGMTCHSCVSLIESTVGELNGVISVTVSLPTKEGTVEYNDAAVTSEVVTSAIEGAGFVVSYVIGKCV